MSLKDLAGMLCDKVEFKQGDGTWTVDVLGIQGVDGALCGGTLIRFNGRWEKIDDSITDVFRKCYAAMNPPGPGEVTLREICEALGELDECLDNGDTNHSVRVFGDCSGRILGGFDKMLKCFKGDPFAAINDLKPKPAPLTELQASHDAMAAKLRSFLDKGYAMSAGVPSMLERAAKLEKKS